MKQGPYTIDDMLRLMERLRDPDSGCPWDIKQNFHSIVPSTLEECYELAEAIEREDFPHVAEELGDVLFQVIFYAQLGRERDLFNFEQVVDALVRKLIRRHPHVFANGELEGVVAKRATVAEVKESWEGIKRAERLGKDQSGILADVPTALPALPRAQKLQKRAATVNFDWPGAAQVLDKLEEEISELRVAMAAADEAGVQEEIGDVLFSAVNLARHLGQDAESSLRHASVKFETRFQRMEALAEAGGQALADLGEGGLDTLWNEAKKLD